MDQKIKDILDEVGKVIRGKDEQIQMVLTAILAKGHILIEDIPGVGKTTMAVCFSRAMELTERRLIISDRKSTRLNSSHLDLSRMPSSA